MSYTNEIFERVSIKGICEALLYDYDSGEKEERDYDQRMKDAYHKFDARAKKFEDKHPRVLPEYANELVSDVQEIYMEIGLQSGLLLALDMHRNMASDQRHMEEKEDIDYKEMYEILFRDITLALKVIYDKKASLLRWLKPY